MNASASLLRLTGARLLALLMVLAVAVLWQPRAASRATGAGSVEALLATAGLQTDKGAAPRATAAAKRASDDRSPGTPPGLGTPVTGMAGPAWRAVLAGGVSASAACPPCAPGSRQAPRAPPLA